MVDHERLARMVARVRQDVERLRVLGAAGVVPPDLAGRVAKAVGRDVLVHEYAEVDDDAVRANPALLGDLDGFVSAVAAWVVRHG